MTSSSEINLPQKFQTAGIHCGIKNDTNKNDLALFISDIPSVSAGVFTQNKVCGAPVTISRARVPASTTRAVIISSGNANTCTGKRGEEDANQMTSTVADLLECKTAEVLVCSTGVIGHFLPMEKIDAGIPILVESLSTTSSTLKEAACGMMTTDTFPKMATREFEIADKKVRITGAAKGAAMIAPNMATMHAVIMTDAVLSTEEADAMLRIAVNQSFNCISVDGHTSTSDTVILLANGAAETGMLDETNRQNLQTQLNNLCTELAQAIIRDAEGADHFVTIDVTGLRTNEEAFCIAKEVAESILVKTAIAGNDPNWGRIVSAAGYAGVEFIETDVSLILNGVLIYKEGTPVEYDVVALSQSMKNNCEVTIQLQFKSGNASATFWTSDLTTQYVRLNSEQTT